jgi:hypothetical protein
MIAYPDGTAALVGDHVDICGRVHSGVVRDVVELEEELKSWRLKEPGLMIETSFGGLVFYSRELLTRDEVRLMSRGDALKRAAPTAGKAKSGNG